MGESVRVRECEGEKTPTNEGQRIDSNTPVTQNHQAEDTPITRIFKTTEAMKKIIACRQIYLRVHIQFGTFTEDYWKALLHGVIIINGHFLSVRKWEERFSPEFIGIDEATHNLSKARFERICILRDLSKPLKQSIIINGFHQSVEFEGVHCFCGFCGMSGHDERVCQKANEKEPMIQKTPISYTPKDEWTTVRRKRPQEADLHLCFLSSPQAWVFILGGEETLPYSNPKQFPLRISYEVLSLKDAAMKQLPSQCRTLKNNPNDCQMKTKTPQKFCLNPTRAHVSTHLCLENEKPSGSSLPQHLLEVHRDITPDSASHISKLGHVSNKQGTTELSPSAFVLPYTDLGEPDVCNDYPNGMASNMGKIDFGRTDRCNIKSGSQGLYESAKAEWTAPHSPSKSNYHRTNTTADGVERDPSCDKLVWNSNSFPVFSNRALAEGSPEPSYLFFLEGEGQIHRRVRHILSEARNGHPDYLIKCAPSLVWDNLLPNYLRDLISKSDAESVG
ncbi:myb-like protein X [Senna tora]|uniref:Myb-like protein X n=1 Tax=Senna tora TaxID=362788 RepID=A0A834TRZ9_9FABA|nr:myb-like protein X [Senna tora]